MQTENCQRDIFLFTPISLPEFFWTYHRRCCATWNQCKSWSSCCV